nr:MAG TPA: hypothetical protein [Caudoviricetes sp.]DAN50609.1 MAG TPA: hypothetical protein [Caudoviricetes sp.]DAY27662.1 MAG TPA: hypothetical protein [Caudoviricetes sp.]
MLTRTHPDLIHLRFSSSWGFYLSIFADPTFGIGLLAGQPMFLAL